MSLSQNARRRWPVPTLAQQDAWIGFLFVLPRLLGFLIFALAPLVAVFVFSFEHRNLLTAQATFAGLDNYHTMVETDPVFRRMALNTLIFSAGLVPLNVLLAFSLAVMLAAPFRGVTIFRTLFFAPVVTSTAAWVIVWTFILQGDQGPLNQLLALIGIQGPNWLREPASAMGAVIVTRVIKTVGLNMVIFLAALQDLPRELVEAARVDGAEQLQVVRHIILPFLAPSLVLVVIITLIGSLNIFDHILLLTNGGPANATMVLAFYVYFSAFKTYEIGYASAIAVVLFLTALTLTAVQWALRRRVVYLET